MISISFLILFMHVSSGPAGGVTLDAVLEEVKWGDRVDSVTASLTKKNVTSQLLNAKDKQAFSRAMLRNGLLETLNKINIKDHFLSGAQGPRARSFLLFRKEGRTYCLLFSEKEGLYRIYVKVPVKVDRKVNGTSNPFDARRLAPLKREIDRLKSGFGIKATRKDRYGNAFHYQGSRPDTQAAVLYLPVEEELRVIYSRKA